MYNMEKEKCRKHHKNPSFSSTLLDEIYRSIDGYDQRKVVSNLPKETKKYNNKSNGGAKPKANNNNNNNNNKSIEDEEIASFRRACLVEKWMEKKVKDKVLMTRKGPSSLPDLLDNDPFFFSSTSSSESNSGTLSTTSSEADCFYSEKSSRNTTTTTTCFAASKSKKSVRRASVSPRKCQNPLYNTEQSHEFYLFDDYHSQKTEENEESLIKSKSRALKIYNNLKKVKQPISPGGRLTNFLSSIFNNGNGKKSKNLVNIERNAKSGQAASSTCSSASSFSRSCLSTKTPPNLTPKFQNGVKRTVRFNPVSVIVDEDCRPCGHKCIYDQESDNLQKLKSQGNAAIIEKNRKYEVTKVDSLKNYQQLKKKNDYIVDYTEEEEEEDDFEDEDAASDSSSDLFEIDHLAFFGNNRFCEELPVYETTHLDTNRGIANRFIR
ncbi:PREDICTED: protein BIG GRAIN 1-like B [Nicotiana attenuata]|uniref:Protein big grain 1-like b n=1 Tax=Nicotiana attenuata TaxID=49451 RepID=A0A1J6INW3_NICAT|nr:PREDICTED: protein BIG GRAIN 1-like B [Nicotiana attenuata]OIT06861.1 protein big grain 1-like b [Nicotiana attenuata]